MKINLKLSKKQKLALDLLNDDTIVDLTYGGGAGGGKSMLVGIWAVLQCIKYPGIRIALGRKELIRLKQSTVVTILREVHKALNVKPEEFNYSDHSGSIQYVNGSYIQFFDLAYQPSDPDFDTLGSLNFTHTIIEEVGELTKRARDVFGSRKNRFMNKEYNIIGKSVSTLNPTQNFMREEVYEPYKALGAGDYQKWEFGKVEINGEKVSAYRAFVKSLVTDNPYISENYIETLKQLPPKERKRLLEGNWDYLDDDDILFKGKIIDTAMIGEYEGGDRYIGVDIADKGRDKTIATLIDGDTIAEQVELRYEAHSDKPISDATALEIIKYAQQKDVNSRQIAIDSIGVGVGVRDFLKNKGWFVQEFIAGGRASEGYQNLRAETLWSMSQAMEKGSLKIYNGMQTIPDLRKEMLAHDYFVEDKVVRVLAKEKIKEKIGHSPDYCDSAAIAYWISQMSSGNPKYNTKRISF